MFSKMPWSSEAPHKTDEREESLTSVLSTTQDRSDLTLLVADATETMRKTITDAFDSKQIGQPSDLEANPNKDLEKDAAFKNSTLDPSTTDVAASDKARKDADAAQDKARKEQEARDKELNAPKMMQLKQAALLHFDEWREGVLMRVGEVVNTRDQVQQQKKEARPQSPKMPSSRKPAEPPRYDDGVAKALKDLYPPTDTPLATLDQEQRALILHSMLLLLLSLESYSAHSRVLLLHLTSSLHLTIDLLANDESKIARGLLTAAEMKAEDETKKKQEDNSDSRKWKVGLATVAGAAIIGVTGGLAAPLLAAGVGSVMGGLGLGATATAGYLGTMASSTLLVGGLFGAYGGRMTGKMMDQYAREVEDFAFVPIRSHHKPRKIEKEYRRLRVAIGISGWLTSKDEVVDPWRVIGPAEESFALRYELEALLNLGNSMTTMLKSAAWGYAKSEIIKRTVFASLTAALWPLALLKVSRIVDNPFSVAKARSDKAGVVLADAIINKAQGERPVTLIGYSLGARVIYICLKTLAERKAFGLIESVVLLGAPTPSTAADWRMIRSVVTGRVVNVYSTSDYILGFLYRSSSIQYGIAGLQAIEGVKGVQNVDASDIITGHLSYRWLTGTILKRIGFEDVDMAALAKEEEMFREERQKEEAERKETEQKEKEKEQQKGSEEQKAPRTDLDSDAQIKELEKQVELKNQASMMDWASERLRAGGATAAQAAVQAKIWYMKRGTPLNGISQPSLPNTGAVTGAVPVTAPNVKAPNVDVPKAELPKVEAPDVKPPNVEAPKLEAPSTAAPTIGADELLVDIDAPGLDSVEAPNLEAPSAAAPTVEADKLPVDQLPMDKLSVDKLPVDINAPGVDSFSPGSAGEVVPKAELPSIDAAKLGSPKLG